MLSSRAAGADSSVAAPADSVFSCSQLLKWAALLESQADAEDVRAVHCYDDDVYRKVGVALQRQEHGGQGQFILDQVQQWDKNGKGTLVMTEFRMGIKAQPPFGLGLAETTVNEIDDMYKRLDTRSNSEIDVANVAKFFERLVRDTKGAIVAQDDIRELAIRLRERARLVVEAAEGPTAAYEKLMAELQSIRASASVDAQIGRCFVEKNIKLVDIVLKWDTSGDNQITKAEFRRHVRELGVVATNKAIDLCFESYDADHGGTLDIEELKPALKQLVQASKAQKAEEERLEKAVAVKKKQAKRAQIQLALEHTTEVRQALETAQRREDAMAKIREAEEARARQLEAAAKAAAAAAAPAPAPAPAAGSSAGGSVPTTPGTRPTTPGSPWASSCVGGSSSAKPTSSCAQPASPAAKPASLAEPPAAAPSPAGAATNQQQSTPASGLTTTAAKRGQNPTAQRQTEASKPGSSPDGKRSGPPKANEAKASTHDASKPPRKAAIADNATDAQSSEVTADVDIGDAGEEEEAGASASGSSSSEEESDYDEWQEDEDERRERLKHEAKVIGGRRVKGKLIDQSGNQWIG